MVGGAAARSLLFFGKVKGMAIFTPYINTYIMFILRKITKAGLEMNFSLGHSYTLVDKERNPEHFRELAEHIQCDEKTYAIVCNSERNGPLCLYVEQSNYIMTEGGKTFANLTQQP